MPATTSLTNRLKVQLKLSISRLRMVQQKDTAIAKQSRRSMATLLEAGKTESAKIRVENIIRSDMNTELLEILELYCELLFARAGLLDAKECDKGLEEAVKSIIYAAPKIEGVKELTAVRNLLAEKYGKEFTLAAMENSDEKVSKKVSDKLRVEPPEEKLVNGYLEVIAEEYDIDWPRGIKAKRAQEELERNAAAEAANDDNDDDDDEGGQKVEALEAPIASDALSRATPPEGLGPRSPVSVVPPSPSTDNVRPKLNVPGPINLKPVKKMGDLSAGAKKAPDNGPGGKIPDAAELTARFAQLKR